MTQNNQLPYTGFSAAIYAVVGGVTLLAGAVLRRLARER